MSEAALRPSDYVPVSPQVRRDPYPYYEVLRREAPVHQIVPGLPFFALSRYEEVALAFHHPELFSSTAFREITQRPPPGSMRSAAGALQGHRLFETPMLISVDPPDHGRLRGLVNRGFTPRRIAALEPRIRELTRLYLDKATSGDRMELVGELAIPLPVTVIAELLGIEIGRRDEFKHWSDALVFGMSGVSGRFSADDVRGAADALGGYIDRVASERRKSPQQDLISVLVHAEGGEALTTDEVMSFAVLLLIAGNETTTNLIGNAMKALLAHPEALAQVQADPSLIPGMLEEALRYESPIQGLPRLLTRDFELAGTVLPEGSRALILIGSANRDAARFADPDRFDIRRDPKEHLAFGHGIHFCLGASLARLEARVAFEELFARCRDFRLETEEIVPQDSLLVRGPRELEVSFALSA